MFLMTMSISSIEVFLKYVPMPLFQVPWQGTGGNEKFFFENENVHQNLC